TLFFIPPESSDGIWSITLSGSRSTKVSFS
ncbi:MAG: hypothetical protein JWR37_3849, partial [Mycobacterium sp.]|nr:hypothetical protein [Mycobacterium sp.]